jgi:hypothetical protein
LAPIGFGVTPRIDQDQSGNGRRRLVTAEKSDLVRVWLGVEVAGKDEARSLWHFVDDVPG